MFNCAATVEVFGFLLYVYFIKSFSLAFEVSRNGIVIYLSKDIREQ